MKRFVNGVEIDLPEGVGQVSPGFDRLYVRTQDGTHSAVAVREGDTVHVSYRGQQYKVERTVPRAKKGAAMGSGEFRAPMPGVIVDILVTEGQAVKQGDRLFVFEAMKTQQPSSAPFDGTVSKIAIQKLQQVSENDLLMIVNKHADD